LTKDEEADMNRRKFVAMLGALPFVQYFKPARKNITLTGDAPESRTDNAQTDVDPGGRVEVLEYLNNNTEIAYYTKWVFKSELEAITFVQSLVPVLTKIVGIKGESTPESIECMIVSKDKPDEILIAGWDIQGVGQIREVLPFWNISNAWTYLLGIRVNGKIVQRPLSGSSLSQYLVEPFRKGNPELVQFLDQSHRHKVFEGKV